MTKRLFQALDHACTNSHGRLKVALQAVSYRLQQKLASFPTFTSDEKGFTSWPEHKAENHD
jgi:hypothetical protein